MQASATRQIRGLVIPMDGRAYSVEIPSDDAAAQLVTFQTVVGGAIDTTLIGQGASALWLIHHEEHQDQPSNRRASDLLVNMGMEPRGLLSAIGGTVIVFGVQGKILTDCPDDTALSVQLL